MFFSPNRYDGTSNTTSAEGVFTGSAYGAVVELTTPTAFLQFESDPSVQAAGFTVSWRCMWLIHFAPVHTNSTNSGVTWLR